MAFVSKALNVASGTSGLVSHWVAPGASSCMVAGGMSTGQRRHVAQLIERLRREVRVHDVVSGSDDLAQATGAAASPVNIPAIDFTWPGKRLLGNLSRRAVRVAPVSRRTNVDQ
jgi:hypothetical protein